MPCKYFGDCLGADPIIILSVENTTNVSLSAVQKVLRVPAASALKATTETVSSVACTSLSFVVRLCLLLAAFTVCIVIDLRSRRQESKWRRKYSGFGTISFA